MSAKYPAEPTVRVGILAAPEITVSLSGTFTTPDGAPVSGEQKFALSEGKVLWNGRSYDDLLFKASAESCRFEIRDVIIGVNFHWERRENQIFAGDLMMVVEKGMLVAVDIVKVEQYLKSVISSEMSATANDNLLRAHAIISRSWLLAQIEKHTNINAGVEEASPMVITDTEISRWQDREDHVLFDVCADDHCQRYQGIGRQTTEAVEAAVDLTRGMVLTDRTDRLCDARFSKCCGGVFEEFESCWEPKHFHYLEAQRDSAEPMAFPDLTIEENARAWILGSPEAFCNTKDKEILGQVLNNYDQETQDFYRWTVEYGQDELAALIKERSGIDYGGIVSLEPVIRGTSGRIVQLRIIGTKRTMLIGKELEIRRTLSKSHLYSSAFIVEAGPKRADGLPSTFRLRGAGWGHGVGLCQIGAAVMGAKGYSYEQILVHYFKGSSITKLY